jgi:hypothetical protein
VTAPTKKKSGKAGTVVVSAPGNGENMPKKNPDVEVLDNGTIVITEEAPKAAPKKKPGEPGFDWQAEYVDEEVFVYTTIDGDVTVGLTKLGPDRKPKPGVLRRINAECRDSGNAFPMLWYFLELASSPTSLKVQELLEDLDYSKMLEQWMEWADLDLGK